MNNRNLKNTIISAFTWTSWASRERKYAPPETLWQKFLYLMSYSEGIIMETPERQPTTESSKVAVSTAMTAYVSRPSSIPTHAYASNVRGESSSIQKGGMLR